MFKLFAHKIFLALLLVLVGSVVLLAQDSELEYSQKLSISEGLAHNGVTCIFKDSRGFIWISTYDGLNRYDGYECKMYKNSLDNSYFVSNRIRTIAEDKIGNLWLGTDEGISSYNYSQEKFSTVYTNKNEGKGDNGPIVRKIFMSDKYAKVICATEGDGILVFNEDHHFIANYKPEISSNDEAIVFNDGVQLDEDTYLFSTSFGIIEFNISNGKFKRPFPEETYLGKGITKLTENVVLLTGLFGVKLYSFEKTADNKIKYKFLFDAYNKRQFTSASVDKLGNLWLGTAQAGIIHINNAENFIRRKIIKQSYFGSNSKFLRTSCILATENDGCWVGTFNKGLFQFDLNEKPFRFFNSGDNLKHGLVTNEVLHVLPIDDDRIILSSNMGGIKMFNTKTEKYEVLPFDLKKGTELNAAGIFVDSKKHIWLRNNGVLRIYDPADGSRKINRVFKNDFREFEKLAVRTIAEDKDGNIWMGGSDDVYKVSFDKDSEVINVETLNSHLLLKNNKLTLIRKIYVDPLYNFVWVGTDSDGLIRVNNEKGKKLVDCEVYQYVHNDNEQLSISSDFVTSILRLPNSELWLGTERGGVVKVVNSDKIPEFVAYSEKNGLSNNVVKNILYDNEYNLWISTNIGLNKFDTKDFRFHTLGKQDGLPFEDFLYPACLLKNEKMLFAGSDGFFYFKPDELDDKELLPKIKFGEITLFNKTILPGDTIGERIVFQDRVLDGGELVLKHNENVLSIELLSLHYSTPKNHFLKYKLEPLNKEWIEVPSDQRVLHYNGLQPGEYELTVMASNSLNEWTKPLNLKINITPPFWMTLPAYILYVLLLCLVVYSIMYYILRMNKLRYNLEIEQLEKDKVKEVNAAKLRFFSNISHEIKTPLTLISGPVNLLAERFKSNEDVQEKLQIVQRQSKKMLRLVNQVHDFQRADANKLKMNYSTFSFDEFVIELVNDFKFKAGNDKKQLLLNKAESLIFVKADRDKLEKILNNLLNNAFKFTKENDSITIDYSSVDNELLIKVIDTGKGIDTEDIPHIFERFYQSQKKHSEYTGGSGIGLAFVKRLVEMHSGSINVESILNKGATFTVNIPIVTTELADVKINKEEEILELEKGFDKLGFTNESINPEDISVEGDFSEARVFFAEDNTDMRNFVSGILSNFFKVQSFANGKECLIALENEWPDIIISDVLMPEMNGFDLCKSVKSDIKTSHVPVILLTACTTIDDHMKGLEVGADSYIKKPFNVQHLVTRTESLLRNRKKLRERFQLDFPLALERKENGNNDIVFLEKLYGLMEKNLDNQNLDLDRLAKELYLNRTHFYQKVKALTNQTPFELLKDYRLKKAAELLVQKQLSVNEVYMMTGFKSRTHFSKLFKETYNLTPGKYASEILKQDKTS